MRAFFRTLLATLAGLLLFTLLLLLLAGLLVGGRELPAPVPSGAVLTIDLSRPIVERPPREGLAEAIDDMLQGRVRSPYTLRELVTAVDRAARDARIRGLFLKGRVARGEGRSGWAALRELREALIRFRKAGKPVISWHEELDEATLYLVSVADRIQLHPLGAVEFNGLAAELLYFREAFDRYGIGVQAVRAGRYKSAVEPFLRRTMSPENREQLEALLGDLEQELISAVAAARKVEPERLRALARERGLLLPEEARAAGLVTHVGHRDRIRERLRRLTGTEADRPLDRQVDAARYFAALEREEGEGAVAVIYVEGTLVPGDDELQDAPADRIARLLRRARRDDEVKAVVLRINSPGGAATAAEVIRREGALLDRKKPLVVSLGSVAASGGYWIATAGREIWVQPNTVTGSIGVFGLFFDLQRIAADHGIRRQVVRTSPLADFASVLRPREPQELERLQQLVDAVYRTFIERVAGARGMEPERVRALAGGRIWSGRRALELGLADHAGGLKAAVAAAARRAGLERYAVVEYQRAEGLADALLRALGLTPAEEGDARQPVEGLWRLLRSLGRALEGRGVLARLPYELEIR